MADGPDSERSPRLSRQCRTGFGPNGEALPRDINKQTKVSLEQTIPFYPTQFADRGPARLKSAAARR